MEINFIIPKSGFFAIKSAIESIENEPIGKMAIVNDKNLTYCIIKENEDDFNISIKKLFE